MTTSQYHTEMMEQLRRQFAAFPALDIPPQAFSEMQGQFLDYIPEHSMMCAFPVHSRYGTALGTVQAGILAAAIANTVGPFSYLVAKRPCVTVNMSQAYIRPVRISNSQMIVEVKLLQKTKSLIYLSAKLTNDDNRTACTASATMVALRDKDLQAL